MAIVNFFLVKLDFLTKTNLKNKPFLMSEYLFLMSECLFLMSECLFLTSECPGMENWNQDHPETIVEETLTSGKYVSLFLISISYIHI